MDQFLYKDCSWIYPTWYDNAIVRFFASFWISRIFSILFQKAVYRQTTTTIAPEAREEIRVMLTYLNNSLSGSQYFCGDLVALADLSILCSICFLIVIRILSLITVIDFYAYWNELRELSEHSHMIWAPQVDQRKGWNWRGGRNVRNCNQEIVDGATVRANWSHWRIQFLLQTSDHQNCAFWGFFFIATSTMTALRRNQMTS